MTSQAGTTRVSENTTRFGSGQAVRRLEDDALLAGHGRFTDDFMGDASAPVNAAVNAEAQSRLVFVRSPYPHARITSIDAAAARAMPGVLHIATGADLVAAGVKPLAGSAGFKRADGTPSAGPLRRALAHEVVRFVGEPVAAVVALTLQQAKDAAEAIFIDYEELPMAVDMDAATAPGAAAPRSACHRRA
jgi:aerobic carbon-monoxide dehydrogenase large subunit